MTSHKQLDANRAKRKKIHGARTDVGKATTRLNAVRDNITGQITTLSDHNRARFEDLKGHPCKASPEPSPNGSVFANDEITAAAARRTCPTALRKFTSQKFSYPCLSRPK
jgi:hypothetical protein